MQLLTQNPQQLRQMLDPRSSLRARMALAYGLLAILLTAVMITSLEMTADQESIDPNILISQLERQIWISSLLLTLVFIAIAWLIAGRIARPLWLIAAAARAFDTEESEQAIPIFPGEDEVASLSRSLNSLVADLKAQQNALREANEMLEQRVAARTRQLAALYDVQEISSGIEELPVLLERALFRILQASQTNTGCIHLIDPDGMYLTMVTHTQIMGPVVGASPRTALNHPLVQKILRQESHLLVADLKTEPYAPICPQVPSNRQALYLPIRKAERNLGILMVLTQETDLFDAEEIALLSALANQLGSMIESARLRHQAEQLAIIDERNRLARQLHDSVTQVLYSTTLFAEAGQKQAQAGNMDKALTYLDDVLDTSRQALKEMRLLVHKLRPSTLEKEGLVFALDQRLKAVEERAGVEPKLIVTGSRTFPVEIEETLYYIAVEALNNSLKHARATAVTITIDQSDTNVIMQVSDNGQGFEWEMGASSGGLGLTSMQERATLQNGRLKIDSLPDQGTTVTVVLPTSHTA